MIEVRKVRHVIEVARHGGFGKAAAALNITQSALTKSVQSVEEHIGVQLLERHSTGVRLTSDGEWFIERGGRLLAEAEFLEADGRAVRGLRKGRLRVGAAPASLAWLWTSALPTFASRFNQIRLEVTADSIERVGDLLLQGDLDLAIGALDVLATRQGIDLTKLYEIGLEFFVRRKHPLDRNRPPSLKEIFSYPIVAPGPSEPHATLIRKLAKENASPFVQPHIVLDSFTVTQRVVEQTDAISIVFSVPAQSKSFRARFRSWPQSDVLPTGTISVARRTDWQPTPAAAQMLAILSKDRLTKTPTEGIER